jgi:hypothetical protein
MIRASRLRPLLKRGALVTAANWPLVVAQFAADSTFKIVLAVPVLGGAFLVGAAAGGDMSSVLTGDLRQAVSTTLDALMTAPLALAAFLLAFSLVIVGGSALMWLIKGGTITVLALAERSAGPIEHPPLRLASVVRASRFGVDRFLAGCGHLGRRYLALGFTLLTVYAVSGGLYLLVLLGGYRGGDSPGILLAWTLVVMFATIGFFLWIMVVNLWYLLMQMVVAVEDCSVRVAWRRVIRFVRRNTAQVAGIFGVVFVLVILSTAASILTAAGLGLIAFVPFFGVLVFPLQLAAWVLRGILFQYLGLTALGAYLTQYRLFLRDEGVDLGIAADGADFGASSWERTA